MQLNETDIARRRNAKRLNESLKLYAAAANNMALAILAAAVFAPAIAKQVPIVVPEVWERYLWALIAFGLYYLSFWLMGFFRSED
jgi:hypothetical protein